MNILKNFDEFLNETTDECILDENNEINEYESHPSSIQWILRELDQLSTAIITLQPPTAFKLVKLLMGNNPNLDTDTHWKNVCIPKIEAGLKTNFPKYFSRK